jgi:hypothetical protein
MDGRMPPQNLDYSLLPLGTKAVAKARKFQPNNGATFSPTNNITRIPLNTTGFCDGQHSYLSFQVTFNTSSAGADVFYDNTGQSFINTIRIEGSDGSQLEYITNYNVLVNAMEDLQVGNDHQLSLGNLFEGSPISNGRKAYPVAGDLLANGATRTFNVKLLTAFLNNDKYLPLGFVSGGGVVLEITWEQSPSVCLMSRTSPASVVNYSIGNIAYIAQIVEMDTGFNDAFRGLLAEQGGVQFHGSSYREHTYAYEANASARSISIPVSERAKSIKSMFLVQRVPAQFALAQYTLGQRTLNALSSWQTRWGGNVYPTNVVSVSASNPGESGAELVKAIASLGNVAQGSFINFGNYTRLYNSAGDDGETPACGFLGLDVEAFAQASHVLESGIDSASLALPISWELQFGAGGAPTGSVTCNTFCLVDVIFTLDAQGLLSVSV